MTNTDYDLSHVDFESWCNVRKRDSQENKAGVLCHIPFDKKHEQNIAHVKGDGGAVSRPDK